jgi:hypothetical protein
MSSTTYFQEIDRPEPSLVSWAATARPVQIPAVVPERLNDVMYGSAAAALAALAVVVGILA